jgi:hypothetical protein
MTISDPELESAAREETEGMKRKITDRFRVVKFHVPSRMRCILAYAPNQCEAQRLCDLRLENLSVKQVQEGYTIKIEPTGT